TPTPAPPPTRTPVSEATPTPTVTPSPMPSVVPSPTPTPTPISEATPTRGASTGSRSTSAYAAPVLLEPRDESRFVGPKQLVFRWTCYPVAPCCLAADEYYVVSIPHPLGVEEGWGKTTEWEAPDYLYLLVPESRLLTWSVSVRRHTGEYSNGQWKGPIVSPISEIWRFWWYTRGGGAPTSPLPTPVSPLPTPGP
ncbi:MAG: hypothetical protein V3S14_11885, partial [Anaerolineae bacterium]